MSSLFLGIDVGQRDMFVAAIRRNASGFRPLEFPFEGACSLEQMSTWIDVQPAVAIGIDAPPAPNIGLLADKAFQEQQSIMDPGNTNRRFAEFVLSIGGCYATLARDGDIRPWMKSGMALYRFLAERGWDEATTGAGTVFEVHPTYGFRSLLGVRERYNSSDPRLLCDPENLLRRKTPRGSVGHGQRQAMLVALLSHFGIPLPQRSRELMVQSIDLCDAVLCAIIGLLRESGLHLSVGDSREGTIVLADPHLCRDFVPQLRAAAKAVSSSVERRPRPHPRLARAEAVDGRLLVLGRKGPGGFSPEETLDALRGDAGEGGGFVPIKGTRYGVDWRSRAFELVLVSDEMIQAVLSVDEVSFAEEPRGPRALYGGSRCPWPEHVTASQWASYVSATFPTPCPVSQAVETFQDGTWRPGLPRGQGRTAHPRFRWRRRPDGA